MQQRIRGGNEITLAFFQHLLDEWRAAGIGHDLDAVLNGAGVSEARIRARDPDIQLRSYYRTVQLAAPLAVHEGFFLRLGRAYDLFDLGILGYALYSAANLRRSWDVSLGQSGGLVPHPIGTTRRVTEEHAGIVLYPPAIRSDARTALCEEWLAGTWRWTCQRLPELESSPAMEVHLDYPPPAYRAQYEEIFPGQVRFNMPVAQLLVPIECYEQPFSSANPSIARLCYQKSVTTMASFERADSFVDEVRFHLLQNAQTPFPTLGETAAAFHLPAHTLHRRLARSGTTFRHIMLEVKMVLARQYLRDTQFTVQEIAYLVGYAQPASFVRAFRDWHGQPPRAFRANGASDTASGAGRV